MKRRHLVALGTSVALGNLYLKTGPQNQPAGAATANRSPERRILDRLGFGYCPRDLEHVQQLGIAAYIEEQLMPDSQTDPDCLSRLAVVRLEGDNRSHPLQTLDWPLQQLWQLTETADEEQWWRPAAEVMAANWIRAVYSHWQLQELLVDFWHNHFNVHAFRDEWIAVTWPHTDRLMRQHALGNFRVFLEAVAQSPAMLIYLDNARSKASPANENFARELFELHTLGRDHYLNDQYQSWRDVPGAVQQQAIGYIDQDIYETARAFTGWTLGAGLEIDYGDRLPATGDFYYLEAWHDPYQKRVLGVEFEANQPPLADGRKVLDLVAFHPGTAQHLCTKLCRRFIADDPPPNLVQKAVKTWLNKREDPHQIRETLRVILQSSELLNHQNLKLKRPFELIASYLRATEADFTPTYDFLEYTEYLGQMLFNWPTPTGYPDTSDYWLSTHGMMARWHSLMDLTVHNDSSWLQFNFSNQMPPSIQTNRQIVDFWIQRLLGRALEAKSYAQVLQTFSGDQDRDAPPLVEDLSERIRHLVALLGMHPDFQWR